MKSGTEKATINLLVVFRLSSSLWCTHCAFDPCRSMQDVLQSMSGPYVIPPNMFSDGHLPVFQSMVGPIWVDGECKCSWPCVIFCV